MPNIQDPLILLHSAYPLAGFRFGEDIQKNKISLKFRL